MEKSANYTIMKVQRVSILFLGSLCATICALLALAGCAAWNPPRRNSFSVGWLPVAHAHPAKQQAAYTGLPAYQLHKGTMKGRTIYA